jgi:FAD/FMN-containing dehydrogenase
MNAIARDLRARVQGRVLVPGDPTFALASRAWNLAVPQPARAVVEAATADDVAALVSYARSAGLAVATQPSGHGASGNTEGVILLRTGPLDQLAVRPAERTARAGAGVRWGRVLAAAAPHGLTGVAGSSPVVSVVGYTLGGGVSWFGRRYGLATGSVRRFEVVDADGVRATVTADTDPDLFWALRGGGGDFAVVTAIEFDLHPAPELYGGRMLWPADRAAEVLAAYRELTAEAPEELTAWFNLLQFPGAPPLVGVDATFLGPAAQGRALLGQLDRIDGPISDSRGRMPVAELGGITAEPTDPGPGLSRAELLTDLADPVAKVLLSEPIDPLLGVQVRHLGGALARPSSPACAAGHLDEPYLLYLLGIPATPELAGAVAAKQRDLVEALYPYRGDRKPYTFLASGETAAAAFSGPVLARLQEIKRRRDPAGVFRSNYPVLAAT